MNIFFWDIDGTLIRTSKAGLVAFSQATEELWNRSVDFANIKAAGMTDNFIARQIIRSVFRREAEPAEIELLCRRYESFLPAQLAARPGWVLPGVREILSGLAGQEDCKLLLLTGNSSCGARIKLKHFGLADFFDFSVSAFAGQYELRVDIARSALASVQANWGTPDRQAIYVIGDTPHDIECGKAIGAYTISVATGTYSGEQLASCSPWWHVDTLPAAEDFIRKTRLVPGPSGRRQEPAGPCRV
ncbi:HAD family hydrolase [Sporomusa termitida]|uniref:PhnX-like: phosphonatase-like hydrolase n=1 Tax=Sporomusa termitida TaxID=2377 RepID=A0A517DQ45_9FIRM|nr:HAD family hydrolase [Sporomusa termitida]QDR79428.1 PhnX-like: phosphonatase-like hydrolase [Sporomusa termitida]